MELRRPLLPVRHEQAVGRHQGVLRGEAEGQVLQGPRRPEGAAALEGEGIPAVGLPAGPDQGLPGRQGSFLPRKAVVVREGQEVYGPHMLQNGGRGVQAHIPGVAVNRQAAVLKKPAGGDAGIGEQPCLPASGHGTDLPEVTEWKWK